jgi:hypothetical protein
MFTIFKQRIEWPHEKYPLWILDNGQKDGIALLSLSLLCVILDIKIDLIQCFPRKSVTFKVILVNTLRWAICIKI